MKPAEIMKVYAFSRRHFITVVLAVDLDGYYIVIISEGHIISDIKFKMRKGAFCLAD